MNALEIRGAFVSLISQVDDVELLKELLNYCVEKVRKSDTLDDLPHEILAILEAAEQDNDLTDTIPNEDAFKMFRAWQKQ